MQDFLAMGGYASFVWPAFGLTALVLGLNVYLPACRERALLRELARRAAVENSTP
ncbi:MAG: heme exporter protein CcmD [Gammaproteobacteria bacterium]|nr:heme exporter protein CcmD [Gammaproteobacteria bacterium]